MQERKPKSDNAVGAENAPPAPKVRVPRLTSLATVRRELNRQYGEHLRGMIGNKTLHVRVFALKAIRDTFVATEIEERLRKLEHAHQERK
jgi:hypothetical protein